MCGHNQAYSWMSIREEDPPAEPGDLRADYGNCLPVSEKAHHCAADAADDVGQVRNVARRKQSAQNLLSQIENSDGDQR